MAASDADWIQACRTGAGAAGRGEERGVRWGTRILGNVSGSGG